jgi:hypothetical protein
MKVERNGMIGTVITRLVLGLKRLMIFESRLIVVINRLKSINQQDTVNGLVHHT